MSSEQRGQLAHIDRDPSNATATNLVFLCLRHHDAYDSESSQSKNYTPSEVRQYRQQLIDACLSTNFPHSLRVEKGLKVGVSGAGHHPRLSAMFRVENSGPNAVRVMAWYAGAGLDKETSFTTRMHESMPVILTERQEHQFSVSLSGIDVRSMRRMGVLDSDNRRWDVAEADILLLKSWVEQDALYDHLRPASKVEGGASSTPTIEVAFKTMPCRVADHLALVVRLQNTGEQPIPIRGAEIAWAFKEPRFLKGVRPSKVGEIGGSVSIPIDIVSGVINPAEAVELAIEGSLNRVLIAAAAADVDHAQTRLRLQSSATQDWAYEDESLPAAIAEVARSIFALDAST